MPHLLLSWYLSIFLSASMGSEHPARAAVPCPVRVGEESNKPQLQQHTSPSAKTFLHPLLLPLPPARLGAGWMLYLCPFQHGLPVVMLL